MKMSESETIGQKVDFLVSPSDMDESNAVWGAMCGHGALAAALGVPVAYTSALFGAGGWVNIPMMKAAINITGRTFRILREIPQHGAAVLLVQWLGSWMGPGVPQAARCRYRHWVAVKEGWIWDCNIQKWIPLSAWEKWVPRIYPPKAHGHEISGVLLIDDLHQPNNAVLR